MEKYLIEHCSPTLASLKTANLFNYIFTSEEELYGYIRGLNRKLSAKGVSVTILRKGSAQRFGLRLSGKEAGGGSGKAGRQGISDKGGL